jgi:hypothetical protein
MAAHKRLRLVECNSDCNNRACHAADTLANAVDLPINFAQLINLNHDFHVGRCELNAQWHRQQTNNKQHHEWGTRL